jgi:type I restriction enzyme S subunit
MSFPRYESYRDSGVEWLGDVPEHWCLRKLKTIASFAGGGTPNRDNLAFWNGGIPWVSPKDMKAEGIYDTEEHITIEALESSAANIRRAGEVLLVVRSGILRHTIPVAINFVSVALNQDMKALAFQSDKCLPDFFLRWVQGLNKELLLVWGKQGATVESIEHTFLAETQIPLPPLEEQSAIAAFLDRETAKIDALVEEQRRLIELLKEKRQALISHTVTKGLDSETPMKDSGVEWLGEVPAHWLIGPVGARYDVQLGQMLNEERTRGDFLKPYLRVFDVQWDSINTEDLPQMNFPPSAQVRYQLKPGDLLVNEGGSYVGRSAIWRGEIEECYYQKALHRLRAREPEHGNR